MSLRLELRLNWSRNPFNDGINNRLTPINLICLFVLGFSISMFLQIGRGNSDPESERNIPFAAIVAKLSLSNDVRQLLLKKLDFFSSDPVRGG